ncbi:hypothetical protein CLAFUW4_00121 [Fulvia fulva]|uniref:F-box domain-containing protein n=1 Tax=Passalora fulva TaxID=5499 RepID=A0A9Q8L7T4_PASFU|nr:uncharacterized protein CLAFUR5_00120 [Fulvia fulva]KAK4636039.1 hypothetical protein CLAFUR4_00121 [Fulvia fulva]KAK4637365.1 hypothetical protein CLAFUR0_00119 [Fulvia fulva]UJO12485.1 hypothetical protein CLAFUR5_00120 [Fulvia fulva]WPV09180.1 hypothetical protein CLAFUW4_00121 [Fulvia fulva]WPV25179.1 hypothetical protein CLAFUW7_00121 [Fulvia fulva]
MRSFPLKLFTSRDFSLTHPDKKRTCILDLPTEMLQRVIGSSTPETLTALRLVCKTFEAATLDTWAKEHITRLGCFILDPARPLRVHDIMSTPRLASRVRTVAFSLSAYETRFGVSLAPPIDTSFLKAESNAILHHGEAQYSQHACGVEGVRTSCWDIMASVMAQVAKHSTCSVVIDIQGEDSVWDQVSRCRPQLVKEILDVALRAGCNVDGLLLTDRYVLKADQFEQGAALERVTHGLRRFAYEVWPSNEADLQTVWTVEHWRIVTAVVETADTLRQFELGLARVPDVSEIAAGSCKLCDQVFLSPNVSYLRKLSFYNFNMNSSVLERIPNACAPTLEIFGLAGMLMLGKGDIYTALFKIPHGMARLQKLRLWGLCQQSSISDTAGWSQVTFLVPGQGEERFDSMPDGNKMDAQPFLSLNLEHGL